MTPEGGKFIVTILITAYVARNKRSLLDSADKIFVEEEYVGPAGPFNAPPAPATTT